MSFSSCWKWIRRSCIEKLVTQINKIKSQTMQQLFKTSLPTLDLEQAYKLRLAFFFKNAADSVEVKRKSKRRKDNRNKDKREKD